MCVLYPVWVGGYSCECACKYPFELFILLATKSALVGFLLIAIDALVLKTFHFLIFHFGNRKQRNRLKGIGSRRKKRKISVGKYNERSFNCTSIVRTCFTRKCKEKLMLNEMKGYLSAVGKYIEIIEINSFLPR